MPSVVSYSPLLSSSHILTRSRLLPVSPAFGRPLRGGVTRGETGKGEERKGPRDERDRRDERRLPRSFVSRHPFSYLGLTARLPVGLRHTHSSPHPFGSSFVCRTPDGPSVTVILCLPSPSVLHTAFGLVAAPGVSRHSTRLPTAHPVPPRPKGRSLGGPRERDGARLTLLTASGSLVALSSGPFATRNPAPVAHLHHAFGRIGGACGGRSERDTVRSAGRSFGPSLVPLRVRLAAVPCRQPFTLPSPAARCLTHFLHFTLFTALRDATLRNRATRVTRRSLSLFAPFLATLVLRPSGPRSLVTKGV